MIIKADLEQGSDAWKILHGSVPSASKFDQIITTAGCPSKSAKGYMLQLAATRVWGVYEDTYQSWSMKNGIDREPQAKELYTVVTGNELKEVGFCYYDERLDRGCSPDALINDDGVLEIKSPLLKTHTEYILSGEFPKDYFQQVQGELYITGRKWAHFMSFFPGAPAFIVKVMRDESFISKLDALLTDFNVSLCALAERIRSRG